MASRFPGIRQKGISARQLAKPDSVDFVCPDANHSHIIIYGRRRLDDAVAESQLISFFTGLSINEIHVSIAAAINHIALPVLIIYADGRGPGIAGFMFPNYTAGFFVQTGKNTLGSIPCPRWLTARLRTHQPPNNIHIPSATLYCRPAH